MQAHYKMMSFVFKVFHNIYMIITTYYNSSTEIKFDTSGNNMFRYIQ